MFLGSTPAVGLSDYRYQDLLASVSDCVARIVWSEIQAIVLKQRAALAGLELSIAASLFTMANGVDPNSNGIVTAPASDLADNEHD